MIKLLQGNVITRTMLGGLTIILRLQVSHSISMPKIIKVCWH